MLRAVSCWPVALLFLASVLPSNAQNSMARGAEPPERRVEAAAGAPLWVECPLRPEQRADWRLDGRPVPGDARPAGEAQAAAPGALTARLHVPAARAHHAGVYTCAAGGARVRVVLSSATAAAAADGAEVSVAEDAESGPLVYFEVRHNITLNCSDLAAGDPSVPLVWKKNGTLVEQIPELKDRYSLADSMFVIGRRAQEDDFGNYSCSAGAGGRSRLWRLHARPHTKLPANTNVVEGQKLKLSCKLIGKPYPSVVWTYSNTSETVENGSSTEVRAALGDRVVLQDSEQGVRDAELVVESALREDAGWYRCAPARGALPGVAAVTQLRVKDMYAALWPFLGICAEVFVLCAIILIYERRRTKPELDDSDTDNHDQKKS